MEILVSEETLVATFSVKNEEQRAKLLDVALGVLRDPKLRKHLGPGSGWWWMATRVLRESGDKPTPTIDLEQWGLEAAALMAAELDQQERDERILKVVKRF